jgi:hypothetical protein
MIRVSKLLEILKTVPPDTLVVVPAFDHSYRHICQAYLTEAVVEKGTSIHPREFSEFYKGSQVGNPVLTVFCIQ